MADGIHSSQRSDEVTILLSGSKAPVLGNRHLVAGVSGRSIKKRKAGKALERLADRTKSADACPDIPRSNLTTVSAGLDHPKMSPDANDTLSEKESRVGGGFPSLQLKICFVAILVLSLLVLISRWNFGDSQDRANLLWNSSNKIQGIENLPTSKETHSSISAGMLLLNSSETLPRKYRITDRNKNASPNSNAIERSDEDLESFERLLSTSKEKVIKNRRQYPQQQTLPRF